MTNASNTISKVSTRHRPRIHTTLLDLVRVVNRVTDNDMLVVATTTHLVNFNHARLTGSFKNRRVVIE